MIDLFLKGAVNRKIYGRVFSVANPGLSFLYSVLMLLHAKTGDIGSLSAVLAFSHLAGALPGIAAGLYVSTAGRFLVLRQVVAAMVIYLFLTAASAKLWASYSAEALALTWGAFIATFFDVYIKKFKPELLVPARAVQSLVWGACCLSLCLMGNDVPLQQVIVGRVIGCIAILALLRRLPMPTVHQSEKSNGGSHGQAWASLAWMSASNAIFLVPALIIGGRGGDDLSLGIVLYAAQFALQAGGRLSDYLYTQEALGDKVGSKEFTLVGGALLTLIIAVSLIKAPASITHQPAFLATLFAIAVASVLWARADAFCLKEVLGAGRVNLPLSCGLTAVLIESALLASGQQLTQGPAALLVGGAMLAGAMVYLGLFRARR